MCLAGHVHADNLRFGVGELDKVLSVTTIGSFLDPQMAPIPERHFGEETETAFDVFSIKNNLLYITRFGAGVDRYAYLYGTKKILPRQLEYAAEKGFRG